MKGSEIQRRTSFIRTNSSGIAHCLASSQLSYGAFVLVHFFRGVGEGYCDRERETFGDGHNDDGHGKNECTDESFTELFLVGGIIVICEYADHKCCECRDGRYDSDVPDL